MPADANRDNVYEVTVRANDGTTTADRMVRVTVTEVDEAPAVMGRDSIDFAENGTGIVATFTADDPEGSTSITWTIPTGDPDAGGDLTADDNADSADFAIDDEDGTLKFNIDSAQGGPAPDFENPQGAGTPANNTYNLVVAASDGALTGYHKVTVKVTNLNEPGEVTWTVDPDGAGSLTTGILDTDNTPIMQFQVGATLAASATDGDISGADKAVGTDEDPTWRWYRGGTAISGATESTYTVGLADARSTIRVVVTYRVGDNQNQESASLTSTYSVLSARQADNALKFDPAAVSREVAEGDEGANVGAPVTATGNHGVVNYTLAGTDANRFEIDQKTGQITTTADLDFETGAGDGSDNCSTANTCSVTVRATDASGAATAATADAANNIFADAAVTIRITNVDEKPTFSSVDPAIGMTAISVAEGNTVLDATVANVTYAATDEDGLNVNLTLMGADAAMFTLSSGTGGSVLSFTKAPDYEMPADANGDNVYEVTVRASDGTMYADRMVKVTVTNVNEAPVIIAGGLSISGPVSSRYAEDRTDAVGTYTARGEDPANARWTLEGADAGDFTLSASTGMSTMLRFRSQPDYENAADANGDNVYMVTLKATEGTNMDTHAVTVTVTDVEEEEPPTLMARYDADQSGVIERDEAIAAITDYLYGEGDDQITRAEAIEVITLYLYPDDN